MTRRRVLIGGSSLLAAPLWARATLAATPDVVVIGAGAAGIAAAKTLLAAGRNVTVIEASDRIGGRIHTDQSIFGLAYDLGAHWLHNAEINPFVTYGQQNGFSLYEALYDGSAYIGGREATEEEIEQAGEFADIAFSEIERAAKAGQDVSPASVLSDIREHLDIVELSIGPLSIGKDLDGFSCLDWYSGASGTDWFCVEGYGALWKHTADSVPVQLSTRAETVHWGGKGVTVETNRGAVLARACIVTVSTGVLANRGLRFSPSLPASKVEAFHGISMGLYNHIALQFSDDIFGYGDDGHLVIPIAPSDASQPEGFGLVTNASGSRLTYADVGGSFAHRLEKEGSATAIDFALSELRKIIGSDVDKAFVKGHATAWGRNPLTYGSYASAKPGATPLRAVLREPVGDRVWFAGEACHESEWATVSGAHKSGQAAARQVLRLLDG